MINFYNVFIYVVDKSTQLPFLNSTLGGRAHGNFPSVPLKSIAFPCVLSECITHDFVASFTIREMKYKSSRTTLKETLLCCRQRQRLLTPNSKFKPACGIIKTQTEFQLALFFMLMKGRC